MQPGTKLGPYQITDRLGAGGMGEVWRARDTKLGREVAIKTLPPEFSQDADRLARFEREAKVLASLNPPNIAAIYGIDEHEGSRFLVLELVEGDTLADRLNRGAIPVEESIAIARQIAAALEAAHDKGVIHRDLKPANIKLTDDGTVKVLDFGLAKALDPNDSSADLSNSPTVSMQATQQGVILGTAAYMSPEQARGRPADKRADIWSFGVVLYEMLTAQPLFQGEDISEILAKVIRDEPALDAVPERVRRLVSKCLVKDPRYRLRDIGDAWELVDDGKPQAAGIVNAGTRGRWLWPIVAGIVAVGLAAVSFIHFTESPESIPSYRFPVEVPSTNLQTVSISPDGRYIAFIAINADSRSQVWIRDLALENYRPLEGTEDATPQVLFWSPDSRWVAYHSDTEGQREVFVRRFTPNEDPPVSAQAWKVSVGGGGKPRWSADGNEIFFLGPENSVWAARVLAREPVFETRAPEKLFVYPPAPGGFFSWDVSDDGRFLFNAAGSTNGSRNALEVITSWTATLDE